MTTFPSVSQRRCCHILGLSRSQLYPRPKQPPSYRYPSDALVEPLRALIQQHPTYGYRRLRVLLERQLGHRVGRKAVYSALRRHRLLCNQRPKGARPRAQALRSRAPQSNKRWSIYITHVYCGSDGWAHLTAIVDCYDRECVGFELSLRARANEAQRALENACLARFGTLRPAELDLVLRSDNGLVFNSRRFRAACADYRLQQEYITPYTPEQNGLIERFFRTLKEECIWQHNFPSFLVAKATIEAWIEHYNADRIHSALGYKSPRDFRSQQLQQAA